MMESKAADVFAFGMFALEVFTGQVPFSEYTNEAVVSLVSQGRRPPGMPENAQEVGLTNDMWTLLENCWQQRYKKRPSMEGVVREWRRFVENGDCNDVAECVQIILATEASHSAPSSMLMVGLETQDSHLDNRRGPSPFELHRRPSYLRRRRSPRPRRRKSPRPHRRRSPRPYRRKSPRLCRKKSPRLYRRRSPHPIPHDSERNPEPTGPERPPKRRLGPRLS